MKNAITVVDQELIDWFDSWFRCDDDLLVFEQLVIDEKTKELLQMAKDLIEINAELTKRDQKYKMAINDQIRFNIDSGSDARSYSCIKQALKGDSDE